MNMTNMNKVEVLLKCRPVLQYEIPPAPTKNELHRSVGKCQLPKT